MTRKTAFTREEVAAAYDAADNEIIGAHLVHGVELHMDLLHLSKIDAADLSDSELECIEWGLQNSNSLKLSVDEFTGRGLEPIKDLTELAHSLQTVIMATPQTASKEQVLEAFEREWRYVRGAG